MILRQIYIVFLGILLALFVAVGISAFYPQPEFPRTSLSPRPVMEGKNPQQVDQEAIEREKQWQEAYEKYEKERKAYSTNVSIISIVAAIVFLVVSLMFLSQMIILSDGFLVGSLATLLYSIFRGFESDDSKYRFVVVSASLVIAVIVGYVKFIKASAKHK